MVVQKQGLLDPIATVETQRPWTEPPGSRAVRLGPRSFSIGGVDSLGRGFVRVYFVISSNTDPYSPGTSTLVFGTTDIIY